MVNQRPRCVWEWGLPERQLESLDCLDPSYFLFQLELLNQLLDGEHKQKAACAIRALYWHSLETFFALVFAALQAPRATYAWLIEYRPGDLLDLVKRVSGGQEIPMAFSIEHLSWHQIANLLLPSKNNDQDFTDRMRTSFAEAWGRFSTEFVDPKCRAEYNTIKHGLRMKSSGFYLSINTGSSDEEMTSLGGSEFGAQFLLRESIGSHRHHIRGRRQMENWNMQGTAERIEILVQSMNNIRGFLLHLNGGLPTGYTFHFPADPEVLKVPWMRGMGVQRMDFDMAIPVELIRPFSEEEIRQTFKWSSA
jgi:hypothetical protein